MATPEVVYLDAVSTHIKRLERAKAILLGSGERARGHKRLARKVSIILGALITVVGIVLARLSETQPILREVLSYVSAIAGAAVSLVNQSFDPGKLREREVALGDLVSQFGTLLEDAKLSLPSLQAQSVQEVKTSLEDIRNREDALLEKAEEWMAGIRRQAESESAA